MSNQLVNNIKSDINNYGPGYSNWSILLLDNLYSFYEIAIVGEKCDVLKRKLLSKYLPNKILIGTKKESALSILDQKYNDNQTLIYVCESGVCKLPVKKLDDALELINYRIK